MTVGELFRLDGRTAIVTGASSGLGVAFAQALARRAPTSSWLLAGSSDWKKTAGMVRDCGRRALVVEADVADPDDCQRVVDAGMAEFGRVDILVNNAGVGTAVPATRETADEFRAVIDLNLNGSYWMAQACGRVMQPGSSIINISSVLALTTAGLPQAAYSASKAGLLGLTRDLAQQWTGRKGIRVNAIAPGFFDSEMTAQYPPEYLESMERPDPRRASWRSRRTRCDGGLPRVRCGGLHHRTNAAGRRRPDDHLDRVGLRTASNGRDVGRSYPAAATHQHGAGIHPARCLCRIEPRVARPVASIGIPALARIGIHDRRLSGCRHGQRAGCSSSPTVEQQLTPTAITSGTSRGKGEGLRQRFAEAASSPRNS